ncbi:hypothetical protein Lal_00032269 [Lupinus albus]|nr:hypothetical protein Lal_00032269 [Lupinus albus]
MSSWKGKPDCLKEDSVPELILNDILKKPPTDALCPIISDNTCILCLIVVAGTELAYAYSPDTVIDSSPGKEVHPFMNGLIHFYGFHNLFW